jgi:hypothetical protein
LAASYVGITTITFLPLIAGLSLDVAERAELIDDFGRFSNLGRFFAGAWASARLVRLVLLGLERVILLPVVRVVDLITC